MIIFESGGYPEDPRLRLRGLPVDVVDYFYLTGRPPGVWAFIFRSAAETRFSIEDERDTPWSEMLPAASVEEAKQRIEVTLRLLGHTFA